MPVLHSANTYQYTIPSFCAIMMTLLQQVQIKVEPSVVMDAFLHITDRAVS